MGKLSIKIKIADREYPMRIDVTEEEHLRIAGRVINEKIKTYSSKFGIDDKQDLLAMAAFDAIVERLKAEKNVNQDQSETTQYLQELDDILNSSNL